MNHQGLFGKSDDVLNTLKVERVKIAKEVERIENQMVRLGDKRKELAERRDNLDEAMTLIQGEHA